MRVRFLCAFCASCGRTHTMKDKRKATLAALIIAGILITYPVRTLVASCYFQWATSILREDVLDKRALPVSGQTLPDYFEAIQSLEKAAVIAPSKSLYYSALSEAYTRIGNWAAVEVIHAPLPVGSMNSRDAYHRAGHYLKAAITSDPSNPNYHFVLGSLYDIADRDSGRAEKELSRAISAYPVNAPLRYAVALAHLKAGRRGDALEHAAVLAGMEDDNLSPLTAYFPKALEIGWRASGNPEVVKGLSPGTPQARKLTESFFLLKGIKHE